ncbi:MAG TPA: hypothetical protein VH853_07095 [Polyangia bacterium]|nr:hypothetical protein [Polyangia bacterium]
MSDQANAQRTIGKRRLRAWFRAWLLAWLRAPRTWTIAGCVAIAFALGAPMIVYCQGGGGCTLSLNRLGTTDDWRHFSMLWEAARVALSDFHQFPSWNPYHCGGLVLYQHPESPFPGPLFLLTYFWLPTAAAMKVWIFAHLVCGTLGARALVADRGGNAAEQLLGAAVMAACGFFAEHIGGGHLSFTPFLYLPLILWAFRRALRDVRYSVLVAGLFAVTVLEGGTYPAPLMAVALAAECLARLGSADDRRGMARALPVIAVLFVLLAGVRLLPALHYLREHPRLEPLDDGIGIGEVFRFWTTRAHARQMVGHRYVWPEYDDYVGLLPVALMLAGVVVALAVRDPRRRERRIDLALFATLVWCALGRIKPLSLAALLHALPIFRSLRVPSRFLGPAMVGFGLLAATALAAVRRLTEDRGARVARVVLALELALVLGVAIDICLVNQRVIQQGLGPPIPEVPASADFFQNTGADYGRLPTFPVDGFGTRACYVALEWRPAPGIADGRGAQARLEPPTAGTVIETSWSPNQLAFDVRLEAPATLIVNQNYETGWRARDGNDGATVGAYVVPERRFWDIRARPGELPVKGAIGLLAVALPAGARHLTLVHRPSWLWPGGFLSLVGVALTVAILRRARR